MPSTLVTPLLIYTPFGVGAANPTYINIPIPVPSQISTTVNAASFTDGFPPNTMTPEASGGLPFFGQDMNGILYMVSAYCANFAAGALSSYNSTLSAAVSGYPVGCVLVNANGNGVWINQVSGNTTDPDTGGAGWLPAAGVGASTVVVAGSNVTLTALQAALPYIAITGTLSANINVIFPANTGQSWIVANVASGAFTVTVKTASGTGVVVPATGTAAPTSVYCDSANIQNTGVSTAGLAPINSPALTGTPTAPTASPATTNNTQIATTAFTQAAITAALALYARLASPVFSGTPTAPTPPSSDNSLRLATTAFVKAVSGISGTSAVNGGINFSFGGVSVELRWGQVNQSIIGNQAHAFSTPFTSGCYVVIPVVASSNGVEFFTVINGSETASGWTQYSNNTTLINYIAVGF
jgi:hypothetical protein